MKRTAHLTVLAALAMFAVWPLLAAESVPAKPAAPCCLKNVGAQRTVTNLDNGVKIVISSNDQKVVALIHEQSASCPAPGCCKDCSMQAKGVTRTVAATASGIVITATAGDPALVKKLQEHAAAECDKLCPHKASGCAKSNAEGAKCPLQKGAPATKS